MTQSQSIHNSPIKRIPYSNAQLVFEESNASVKWRIDTLLSKEPDTVNWISQFRDNDILIDIGANIGLYTVLAAVTKNAKVFAFEPESQNFAQLMRHIVLNDLHENVVAFCAAVGESDQIDKLYLSNFGLGGSCHTFGDNLDFNLKKRPQTVNQGCISVVLDKLIQEGVVDSPHHIKIDVDGLEHSVIAGCQKVLQSEGLQSVLVELNTNLESHKALIPYFQDLGYVFSERQVELGMVKEGMFKNTGNFIFYKPSSQFSFDQLADSGPLLKPNQALLNLNHTMEKFHKVTIIDDPFPHFYIENILPPDFYTLLMKHKPQRQHLVDLVSTKRARGERYCNRLCLEFDDEGFSRLPPESLPVWNVMKQWLTSKEIIHGLVNIFGSLFKCQLAESGKKLTIKADVQFTKDIKGYGLGPHTDSPERLMSLLFYLPEDESLLSHGTSVYQPLEKGVVCSGGPHYDFDGFETVKTMPFKPNSVFGFIKTTNSFHGVDIINADIERDAIALVLKCIVSE
ncbi:MAG: FkbM family methyltransferase [Pseudomonadales bacterium]|nr:FkbM family methyltransferase [Pseudomonadales bacterium]